MSVSFSNAGTSSWVLFVPSAAGFAVGRLLDLPVGAIMLLGRLANGFAALLITAIGLVAVRRLRVSWLFMTVSLMPMVIYRTSFVNADTLTQAVIFAFLAIVADITLRKDALLDRRKTIVLVGLALGLGFVKFPYPLMVLLILFLPRSLMPARKRRILGRSGLVVATLAVAAIVLKEVAAAGFATITDLYPTLGIDPQAQLQFLFTHPLATVSIWVHTAVINFDGWINSGVGTLGYNEVRVIAPFSTVAMLSLFVASLYSEKLRSIFAWLWIGMGVLVVTALTFILYLNATQVGSTAAAQLQDRYVIPCIPLILLGVASLLPLRVSAPRRWLAWFFPVSAAISLSGAFALFVATMY